MDNRVVVEGKGDSKGNKGKGGKVNNGLGEGR
jgi:hypothetical protein